MHAPTYKPYTPTPIACPEPIRELPQRCSSTQGLLMPTNILAVNQDVLQTIGAMYKDHTLYIPGEAGVTSSLNAAMIVWCSAYRAGGLYALSPYYHEGIYTLDVYPTTHEHHVLRQ